MSHLVVVNARKRRPPALCHAAGSRIPGARSQIGRREVDEEVDHGGGRGGSRGGERGVVAEEEVGRAE